MTKFRKLPIPDPLPKRRLPDHPIFKLPFLMAGKGEVNLWVRAELTGKGSYSFLSTVSIKRIWKPGFLTAKSIEVSFQKSGNKKFDLYGTSDPWVRQYKLSQVFRDIPKSVHISFEASKNLFWKVDWPDVELKIRFDEQSSFPRNSLRIEAPGIYMVLAPELL